MSNECFEKFPLTKDTVARIKEAVKSCNNDSSSSAWHLFAGRSKYEDQNETKETSDHNNVSLQSNVNIDNNPMTQFQESQFFYTQIPKLIFKNKGIIDSVLTSEDVLKNWMESLEYSNQTIDFEDLIKLSENEQAKVIDGLRLKLSENGTSNFCDVVYKMSIEHCLKLMPIFCSAFFLPKIIEMEKDSLSFRVGLRNCVSKFPDEIRNFIFNKILNNDVRNTSTIVELLKAFGIEEYPCLLNEFVCHTRELKEWHFSILEILSCVKSDECTRYKLLKLFLDKAMTFSKAKIYAKLILDFVKINSPLSSEEKAFLREIAALNQTKYKKIITMYSER